MRLSFLGAVGEVTGSRYLFEVAETRFFLECGMFQGRDAQTRNRVALKKSGEMPDFVILSHAHIDHSGLLPRLTAEGFRGPIYATPATCELLQVMLPDSAHLQEREAEYLEKRKDHGPVLPPLYTQADVRVCLSQLVPHEYGQAFDPAPGVRCTFHDAGHILGSAIVTLQLTEAGQTKTVVFSGDLGQPGHPVVRDPERITEADVLLLESTYGDRTHKNFVQTLDEFAFALNDVLRSRRGNVVIPAFAVGRTQDILQIILRLYHEHRLPAMDIYVDSPMANAVTRITMNHPELYDCDATGLAHWLREGKGGPRLHFSETVEASMAVAQIRSGAVIISASGMCEGGRIRRHLAENLGRPECAVVFTGFQAMGTLGRRLVDGARSVRLFGETCPVRARIFTIGGLSAHADQQALLKWTDGFTRAPTNTWIVHGEPLGAQALAAALQLRGWSVSAPSAGDSVVL